jgi:DNA-binding LytR/AlgR family response regulator
MTKPLRCIVVDDEPLARKGMELLIAELSYLELEEEFSNGIEAMDYLKSNEIDLIFLDIEMPGLNGLDFLKSLKQKTQVILCTAYPQFALEAFELDVIDYLVKPIAFNRFYKAAEKAKEFHELFQSPQQTIDNITDQFIFIRSERKLVKLFFKDIKYIKGLKDYVMIYTTKDKYITAMNVKTIHKQLPDSTFARVNKSVVINVDYLTSVDHDLILLSEDEFTLGNTYKDYFLKTYIKDKLLKR